jgi:hypothetical protein
MLDLREDWTDHKPARSAANRFIKEHGFAAFGKWYLGRGRRGSRTQQAALQVSAWRLPDDSPVLQRCPQKRVPANTDIRRSSWRAAHLREMLDALMSGKRSSDLNHVSSA